MVLPSEVVFPSHQRSTLSDSTLYLVARNFNKWKDEHFDDRTLLPSFKRQETKQGNPFVLSKFISFIAGTIRSITVSPTLTCSL